MSAYASVTHYLLNNTEKQDKTQTDSYSDTETMISAFLNDHDF